MDFIDGQRDESGNVILSRRAGSFDEDVVTSGDMILNVLI